MLKGTIVILLALCAVGAAQASGLSLIASRNLAGDVSGILAAGELAQAVRASGGPTLLVDLGGALSPSEQAFEHRRQGSLTVDLMNRSGFAAWFLGGRDLAWSNQLTRFLRRTDFPVLAANLHRPETGSHLFQVQPYTVVRVAGKRVGLIGLSGGTADVLSSDPVEAARYYARLMASRADLIIVASAAGPDADLAIAQVEGIDLVVGVDVTSRVLRTDGGWIVATEEGQGVWGIDLTLADGKITGAAARRVTVFEVDPVVISQAFLGWTVNLEGEPVSLGTVIGRSDGGFRHALTSPLGYYVADVIRDAAQTDGALVGTNHFPDDFTEGDITVYDLFRAYSLPFTVGVVSLKGSDLIRLLDLADGELRFYPSGIDVVYATGETGGGLVESTIGGKPIDPRVDYTIAIERGASDDPILSALQVRDTGQRVRDLICKDIRMSEAVKGVVDGRIQRR